MGNQVGGIGCCGPLGRGVGALGTAACGWRTIAGGGWDVGLVRAIGGHVQVVTRAQAIAAGRAAAARLVGRD
jgi:hypothetical protein